jgi:hypothetical protein
VDLANIRQGACTLKHYRLVIYGEWTDFVCGTKVYSVLISNTETM